MWKHLFIEVSLTRETTSSKGKQAESNGRVVCVKIDEKKNPKIQKKKFPIIKKNLLFSGYI